MEASTPLTGELDLNHPSLVVRRTLARLIDFSLGVALFIAIATLIQVLSGTPPDGTGAMLIGIAATFVVYNLYEIVLPGLFGWTLGKRLFGLVIVREDGSPIGIRTAAHRNLIPMLVIMGCFVLYPLVYLLALAGDHRGPHDVMAGTRVVSAE